MFITEEDRKNASKIRLNAIKENESLVLPEKTVQNIAAENTNKLSVLEKEKLIKEHNAYKNVEPEISLPKGMKSLGPPNNRIVPDEQINRLESDNPRVTERIKYIESLDLSDTYDENGNYLPHVIIHDITFMKQVDDEKNI